MSSIFGKAKAPKKSRSSTGSTGSKFDLSDAEASLVDGTGVKRKLPSEGHDELPLSHKKPKLTPSPSTQAEVEQPRPLGHPAFKEALFDSESVTRYTATKELDGGPTADFGKHRKLQVRFLMKPGPSGRRPDPPRRPKRVSYKHLLKARRLQLRPYTVPMKQFRFRLGREIKEIRKAAKEVTPLMIRDVPNGPYFYHPDLPSPTAGRSTPSSSEPMTGAAIMRWVNPVVRNPSLELLEEKDWEEDGYEDEEWDGDEGVDFDSDDDPTVRLATRSSNTAVPEEPLHFRGADGGLLGRFTALNMVNDRHHGN